MSKVKDFFERFKKIKHLHIYIAVLIGIVICLIYFCGISPSKKKTDKPDHNSTENYGTSVEYIGYLENKLSNVLSKISGVGNVNVIITLENGFSYEYATDTETKTIVSGGTETTVTTETIILVSNEPVIVKEIYPNIKGVVVVADGAKDVGVRLNILSAVETVLEVDRNNVTILT